MPDKRDTSCNSKDGVVKKKGFISNLFINIIKVLTLAIVAVFVILIIYLSTKENVIVEKIDINAKQFFIINVDYNGASYYTYCTSYFKDIVNESFVLIDYNDDIISEIVVNEGVFFRSVINPAYKKEYFEIEKDSI